MSVHVSSGTTVDVLDDAMGPVPVALAAPPQCLELRANACRWRRCSEAGEKLTVVVAAGHERTMRAT